MISTKEIKEVIVEKIDVNQYRADLKEYNRIAFYDYSKVKVEQQGDTYAIIRASNKKQSGSYIQKIGAGKYIVKRTGEVKYYANEQSDEDHKRNLIRKFEKLKGLARNNFLKKYRNSQLFITLTYAENMKDRNKLAKDFENFIRKFRKIYKKRGRQLEYIAVAEPQERGAWHMHILIKAMDNKYLYVDKNIVNECWGYGFTDTQRLKCEDVGNYFVAYCSMMEQSENSKKKASRLHLYPKNFKFYRRSKGIKDPQIKEMLVNKVKEMYKKLVYEKLYALNEVVTKMVDNVVIKTSRIINLHYKSERMRC